MQRLVCVVVVALAGVLPAGAADLPASGIRSARDIYDAKCANCHKFYDPADYSQKEWDKWMAKMWRKAKLKGAQRELLSKYLQAMRENAGK